MNIWDVVRGGIYVALFIATIFVVVRWLGG